MKDEVLNIFKKINSAGFEVAAVGGSVRDILSGVEPNDWDLTTNAKPEDILDLFTDAFYNNQFGTVGIPVAIQEAEHPHVVEVTTYRTEKSYSDSRHPDKVYWGKSLDEDLKRRDFTINAMAMKFDGGKLIETPVDLFEGAIDLKHKIIRAVGKADERFSEDALRILRAIRFATVLNFEIEEKTKHAVKNNAALLKNISGNRIRDEIFKIVNSDNCDKGFFIARDLGVLEIILPELNENFGVEQKKPKKTSYI